MGIKKRLLKMFGGDVDNRQIVVNSIGTIKKYGNTCLKDVENVPILVDLLYKRQHRKCFYCGKDLMPWRDRHKKEDEGGFTVDHFYAKYGGNLSLRGNAVISCFPCNARKGTKKASFRQKKIFNMLYGTALDIYQAAEQLRDPWGFEDIIYHKGTWTSYTDPKKEIA